MQWGVTAAQGRQETDPQEVTERHNHSAILCITISDTPFAFLTQVEHFPHVKLQ